MKHPTLLPLLLALALLPACHSSSSSGGDAVADLGGRDEIGRTFAEFQKCLYKSCAA